MNGRLVKGVNFMNLIDAGNPIKTAKIYEQNGADELVLLDITATYEKRNIIYDLIEHIADEISIPLTVGGGVCTIEDFRKILACGADKVSVNSSAVENPNIIKKASNEFGRQCVVVSIDGKDDKVYIHGGKKPTEINVIEWAKNCEQLGAGEILFTSIGRDGTQRGYDIEKTKLLTESINIPVIASGGCGSIDDIINVFNKTNCDAALVASLFHYGKATINDVKLKMEEEKIPCRMILS